MSCRRLLRPVEKYTTCSLGIVTVSTVNNVCKTYRSVETEKEFQKVRVGPYFDKCNVTGLILALNELVPPSR